MRDTVVFDILIKKLIQQEKLLADYYGLCRKRILKYRKLWDFLIKEEIAHSKILENLIPQFNSGEVYITSDLINLKILDYSLDCIRLKMNEIEYKNYSTLELLEFALQFELCSLESVIFDSIGSEDQTVVDKMKWLQKGSERHCQILEKAVKQNKNIFFKIIGIFQGLPIPSPEETFQD